MKNSHLSKYNLTAFALTALTFIPIMASSGWATIIEGNLEVKAGTGTSSSNGNLTVDGTTTLKGTTNLNGTTILGNEDTDIITVNGPITANDTLTVEGALKIKSVDYSSDGISTNMTENQNNNDTIPTTLAVSSYVGNKFEEVLNDVNFGPCHDTTTNCIKGRKTVTVAVGQPVSFCIVGASALDNNPNSNDRFILDTVAKVNSSSSDNKMVDVVVQRFMGAYWGGDVKVSGTLYCYKW